MRTPSQFARALSLYIDCHAVDNSLMCEYCNKRIAYVKEDDGVQGWLNVCFVDDKVETINVSSLCTPAYVAERFLIYESTNSVIRASAKQPLHRWTRPSAYMCCVKRLRERPYIISHIVDSRTASDGSVQYRVHWVAHHKSSSDTWEPASTLEGTHALQAWLAAH